MIVAAYEREEFGVSGQRRYITSSAQEFFFYYFQLPANQRTHYEVIPLHKTCKLYFDLEFDVSCNPCTDGPKLVETFINFINAGFVHFGFEEAENTSILNLDSSSADKFSCHLIFTRTVFRSNEDIGRFVRTVLAELNRICKCVNKEYKVGDNESSEIFGRSFALKELENLFVRSGDEMSKQVFVDSAVYSKNRNFRMYKSSKLGKNKFLNRAERCVYAPIIRESDLSFYKQLKKKEAANVDINPELYRTFLDSLITNIDFEPRETITFEAQMWERNQFDQAKVQRSLTGNSLTEIPKPTKLNYFIFPEVEEFVISTLTEKMRSENVEVKHGINFRSCKNLEANNMYLYELAHYYRYCERIKRFHKSNKVYICVDLTKLVFYQKCFDPDCSGFRGNEFPIPRELMRNVEDAYDDWGD